MDSEERNDFIYDKLNGTPDRFIKSIINKHYETLGYCEGVGYTDLIQEGWIALMLSAKRYDNQQDVKFSTFAYPRVRGRIIRTLGKEIKNSQAEGQYNQEVFADSVERVAHVSKGFEELDEEKQEILKLYSEGHTQDEISEKTSFEISQRHVGRILENIKSMSKNAPNS